MASTPEPHHTVEQARIDLSPYLCFRMSTVSSSWHSTILSWPPSLSLWRSTIHVQCTLSKHQSGVRRTFSFHSRIPSVCLQNCMLSRYFPIAFKYAQYCGRVNMHTPNHGIATFKYRKTSQINLNQKLGTQVCLWLLYNSGFDALQTLVRT